MSLGIAIKGPEGIVLGAESRVTLESVINGKTVYSTFDNATKILSFNGNHRFIGVVTYGLATIGQRTAHSFLPEFESQLPPNRISTSDFAQNLSDFYLTQWKAQAGLPNSYTGSPMIFIIAGFDLDEPYGKAYEVQIPSNPAPREIIPGGEIFNMVWGGQRETVDRIVQGIDPALLNKIENNISLTNSQKIQLSTLLPNFAIPTPLNIMALQDCIDFTIFLIRTTIDAQKLMIGLRGCGGPIDIAIINRREGLRYIQKKENKGEKNL